MFRFGMWALERARSRLREWPQYCALLQQNRQIEQADADLYRYICSCADTAARLVGKPGSMEASKYGETKSRL